MPSIDFCKMIADRITSEHNQHATLLIWAGTGTGKSWTMGAICETIAQYVSEIKGGNPEDYFNIDNVAVITQSEVLRLLQTKMDVKYNCIACDDIGVGWNARDFMNQFNQSMNDIWQTFRTRNNFLCLTLPDPMLIDKVPREMVKYVMKIEASHHDFNYVECKIQEPMKKVQWGKKIYPYLLDQDGQRIVRHIVFRPSQKFVDAYEPKRAQIERQNTGITIQDMRTLIQEEFTPQEPHHSKKVILSPIVKKLYNNGKGLSMREISEYLSDENSEHKISTQTISEALKYNPTKIEGNIK